MCTIVNKRTKVGNNIQEHITDLLDNSVMLLALVEGIPQTSIDSNDVVNVPKHLRQESLTTVFRYNI